MCRPQNIRYRGNSVVFKFLGKRLSQTKRNWNPETLDTVALYNTTNSDGVLKGVGGNPLI